MENVPKRRKRPFREVVSTPLSDVLKPLDLQFPVDNGMPAEMHRFGAVGLSEIRTSLYPVLSEEELRQIETGSNLRCSLAFESAA